MRTFIAVELDKNIKEALSKIQLELEKADADAKWVSAQNIHLTLKFLGEVKEEKIPKIIQCLKETADATADFQIEIRGAGAFPGAKSPRVIWAGISKGKEELLRLAGLIEDGLVKLKFPKEERKLCAHITIGRVKSPKNKDALSKAIAQLQLSPLLQQVKSITLFKSTLTPKGPLYEKLSEEKLKKS